MERIMRNIFIFRSIIVWSETLFSFSTRSQLLFRQEFLAEFLWNYFCRQNRSVDKILSKSVKNSCQKKNRRPQNSSRISIKILVRTESNPEKSMVQNMGFKKYGQDIILLFRKKRCSLWNPSIFNIIRWNGGSTERSFRRLMVQCLFW